VARYLTASETELAQRAIAAAAYSRSDVTSGEIEKTSAVPPPTSASAIIGCQLTGIVSGPDIGAHPNWTPVCLFLDLAQMAVDPASAFAEGAAIGHGVAVGQEVAIGRRMTLGRQFYNDATSALAPLGVHDDLTSLGIVTTTYGDAAVAVDRPFEWLDENRDESARFRALLQRVRQILPPKYRDKLIARVQLLAAELDEEEPGRAPSSNSLQSMISFLMSNPLVAFPEIVLIPDGHLRAEWHRGRDRHLTVTFLPGGEVRYVIFAKRLGTRLAWPMGKVDRQSGMTSIGRLMDVLAPFAPMRWMVGEG
jgi:hypothetical protein